MAEIVMMTTTAGSRDEARRIAATLIDERLAACVQVMPVDSYFPWEGEFKQASELVLFIKTTVEAADAVQARILDLHSYNLPEVLILPVAGGLPDYLDWIDETVAKEE